MNTASLNEIEPELGWPYAQISRSLFRGGHLDVLSAFRSCARDPGFLKAHDGCDTTTELHQPSSRALGLTQTRQRIDARGRPRRNQAG